MGLGGSSTLPHLSRFINHTILHLLLSSAQSVFIIVIAISSKNVGRRAKKGCAESRMTLILSTVTLLCMVLA